MSHVTSRLMVRENHLSLRDDRRTPLHECDGGVAGGDVGQKIDNGGVGFPFDGIVFS